MVQRVTGINKLVVLCVLYYISCFEGLCFLKVPHAHKVIREYFKCFSEYIYTRAVVFFFPYGELYLWRKTCFLLQLRVTLNDPTAAIKEGTC